MSGKTVKRYVHVTNPETGESEVLSPGMKVPDYAKDQVTNDKVFTDPDDTAPVEVNNEPVPAPTGEVPDGKAVDATASSVESPADPGPVNETVNANPAQRDTADKPGGNQAAKVGEVAPVDSSVTGVVDGEGNPVGGAADVVEDEAPAPAKKAAAKKTTAKRTPAKKAAAKKTTGS